MNKAITIKRASSTLYEIGFTILFIQFSFIIVKLYLLTFALKLFMLYNPFIDDFCKTIYWILKVFQIVFLINVKRKTTLSLVTEFSW